MATDKAILDSISEATIAAYPRLQAVKDAYDKGNEGKAIELLQATPFYKNVALKDRALQKVNQNGIYQQQLDAFLVETDRRSKTAGVRLTPEDLRFYGEKAFDLGLTNNQFDNLILKDKKTGIIGGQTLGTVDDLESYADSFGVANLLNADYWDEKKTQILAGELTTEDIQNDIRELSASAYPNYADQINSGTSLKSLASGYKATIAQVLEMDSSAINWQDKNLQRALQYVDPKTGQPAKLPVWEFKQMLRSTDAWQYTDNATEEINSVGKGILKDWGLM